MCASSTLWLWGKAPAEWLLLCLHSNHFLVSFIRPRLDETSVITNLGHWKYKAHFSTCPFMGKMCSPADVSFMLRWSDFSLSGKRLRDGRNLNFVPHPLFVICTSLWSSCCGVYCPDGCTEAKGTCNMLHRFQHLRSPIKAKRLI